MRLPLFTFLLTMLFFGPVKGQITAKVVDEKSGEPVAFATVLTGERSGVITNEDGFFSLTAEMAATVEDSLRISSMGYENMSLLLADLTAETVELTPKTFELGGVFLNANVLSAEEIVERVKANVATNYEMGLSRKKIFFRESEFNHMDKVDIEFKKSSIPELNKQLIDSIAGLIPKNSAHYQEVAGDFYGDYRSHKFYVDKAAELYDKRKDVSMDGLGDKLEKIFQENVKKDSYIKIRSGLFGTKIQLDSAQAGDDDAAIQVEVDTNDAYKIQSRTKNRISELYSQLFFHDGTELDFLEKSNRYSFKVDNYTFIDELPVYIVRFEPKGSKDFTGVMYVNTEDFAIMRLEFDNVRPLQKFGLLGITYRRNVYRGKMLFSKDADGKYSPRYIELEDGQITGVDRPLNVIEKNKNVKGRRKQNELALHFDVGIRTLEKRELVVFDSEPISQGEFEGAKENPKAEATYLSAYDPSFWTGHTIMAPNEAIQQFKVVE